MELSFHVPFFGAFLVASAVFGIGLGSPYWIDTQGVYTGGIWYECVAGACKTLAGQVPLGYWWMTQTQMVLAVLLLFASSGFYIMWMMSSSNNWMRLTSSTCTVVAGLLGTGGVVTFGVGHMHNQVLRGLSQRAIPNGWAYWLTVHGSLNLLVLGCINASYALSHHRHAYVVTSSSSELTPDSLASKDAEWTQSSFGDTSDRWTRT